MFSLFKKMDVVEIKRLQRKIDRAREYDELKEALDMCMELASYFASYENYENAVAKYKEALSISEEKGWHAEAAVCQRMIAETYCSLGEYKEAVKHAEFYLNYSKRCKDKIEEQRSYATKGRIYFCWAEFLVNEKSKCRKEIKKLLKESLTAYEESLKICEGELNEVDAREKQEMKARLFHNLGLVMGSLGNFREANAHFATAIQINKSQNFKENLYLCYINQGEYFLRAGECTNACTYFDLAIKIASSKENTNEALKLKAKAYLKIGNVSAAKNILREVYKQQLGKDSEVVEQLRIVVYLCKVDKMIASVQDNDYQSKKKLFEKKGDAYCALKQYGQGVEAYLKMLEYAEKASSSVEDLLPCYSSLSQTYRDNEQYTSALMYCQKELELLNENSVEASRTYLFLAELYELLDHEFEIIYSTYKKAQKISQEVGDKGQEISVLRNIIQMQKDFGYVSLAEEYEKRLEKLEDEWQNFSSNDCEDEGDCNNTENFIFDIDDDELFSDVENDKPRHQVRRTCYKIKRNQKGETELHVATIRGNYSKVKSLIEKGHPVNEKDLAGWTVLHEACNHGHVEIVDLLLSSGADINNTGGDECGGITPLHDAAENGHFPVIKLLLKKGACPAVLTNDGDTPLDCLKRWKSRTSLTEAESYTYEKLCDALKTNLDSTNFKRKTNQKTRGPVPRRKPALETDLGNYSITNEVSTSENSCKNSKEKAVSATEFYRAAIEGVRRKHNTKMIPNKCKINSPLISEEDVVEDVDWLEDDMEIIHQPPKRRKFLPEEPAEPDRSVSRTDNGGDLSSEEEIDMILGNISMSDNKVTDATMKNCSSPVFNVYKVKSTGKGSSGENHGTTTSTTSKSQTSCLMLENRPEEKENPPEETNLCKFKIQILNDLFLVPISKSQVNVLTVEWLAKEAAERYNKVNGKRPVLLLMTEDDAIATKDDPIALLVNEKIKTRILGWKEVSLAKKYEEESFRYQREISFSSLDSKPDLSIMNALNVFCKTGNLILRNLHLEVRETTILFEILEKEKCDVKILDLSRNCLRDDGLEPLMRYLESRSVERLYLRSNGISAEGIRYFSERLKDLPETNLSKILTVDFSYNILRDVSADFLNAIIDQLKNLECLGIENCCLTKSLKGLKNQRESSLNLPDKPVSTNFQLVS